MNKIKKNKYHELSALIDADSFFYGLYSENGLESIQKESVIENENRTFDVDSAKIGIRSNVFVHVPSQELTRSRRKAFLTGNPNFDRLKNPHVLVDKINEEISTVWAIENSELTQLKSIRPRPAFFHYSTAFIKLVLNTQRDGVYVNFVDQVMDLVVVNEGNLFYYNRNEYFSVSDVLYFTLLAYRRGDLKPLSDPLFFMGEVKLDDEIYNSLSEYIANIGFLQATSSTKTNNHLYHQVAPIDAVLLCGS